MTDADAVAGTPKAAQDAYHALRAASTRYGALRTAQRHVYTHHRRASVGRQGHGAVQPARTLRGRWLTQHISVWRPSPEHPLLRPMWLATSDARPWMPTRAEADAVARRIQQEFAARSPRAP